MYSEPWARLTRFMMPNTSVNPAAIRKSITPYWRPLSVCSSTSAAFIGSSPRLGAGARRLPLHGALGGVRVLVVLEDGLLDLHRELAVGRLDRLEQVEVLDREVVHVVLVRPARRLVVGLPHRRDHALFVGEVALHGANGGVDQHDAVVALRPVEDRRLAEFLAEVRDVLLVRVVLEVGAPVARLELAERGALHRRQRDLVDGVDRIERNLAVEPRLLVLLEELDAH